MYDKIGFLDYFANEIGASANTCATYSSFLNRIDAGLGGLDEALDAKGAEAIADWAKAADVEPFATYRAHARSVLKRYSLYRLQKVSGGDAVDQEDIAEQYDEHNPVLADANFLREKEMQVQVRQQLGSLEAGLFAVDGGKEVAVATGRIDILAKDDQGRFVVIELKPGKCPAGALEQLLAYAYDLEQEKSVSVRAMLIAGSFTDRIRAAARRAGGIDLKTYAYSLSFTSDD